MVKESLSSPIKPPIFKETFNSEQSTRNNGGTPTAITYSNGVGTFDGATSKINYPMRTISLTGNSWIRIKYKQDALATKYFLLANSGTAGKNELRPETNNALVLESNTSSDVMSSSSAITDTDWHEFVYSTNSGVTQLYKDGVAFGSTNSFADDLLIDQIGNYAGSNTFAGSVELLEFGDNGLSAEEVESMYNGEYYRETNRGLVGEWKLGRKDETLGSDLASGWDFTNWTTTASASVDNATQFTTSVGAHGIYKTIGLVVGKAYRINIAGSADNGSSVGVYTGVGGTQLTGVGGTAAGFDNSMDFVYAAAGSGDFYIRYNTTGQVTITKLEIYEVQANDSGGQSDTGAELVTNGSMEADANWADQGTPETNERSSTYAHLGTYSRHAIDSTASFGGFKSDTFTVTAGKVYKISFWYYGVTGTIRPQLIDGGGATIWNTISLTTKGVWTRYTANVTSLTSGSSARVAFINSSNSAAAEFYIDDVSVRQYTGDGWITAPNNGSLINFPATIPYTTGPSGFADTALTFDGTNDYIVTSDDPTTGSVITISAWIKTSNDNTNIDDGIFGKWDTGETRRVYLFIQDVTTNCLSFLTSPDGTYSASNRITSTTAINDGVWHHIVGVHDGSSNFLYIDGVLVVSADVADGLYNAAQSITTGVILASNAPLANSYFNGDISDTRIYNRALGPQEVKNIYKEAMRGINK